jgi:ketosteroid isomerase-like protein
MMEEQMTTDTGSRLVVERYAAALPTDWDALDELRHPDFVEDWPQSGERIRGHASYRAIHESYPGGQPSASDRKVRGSEDKWVVTPTYTPMRIVGSGDTYFIEARIHYADGDYAHFAGIVELRDGKIAKQTSYFAMPFEAPAWRAALVDRMPPMKE